MHTLNEFRDSSEPQLVFVALFDVLGFKSRLRSEGLDSVRFGYRDLMNRKLEAAGTIPVLSRTGGTNHLIASTIFSDTILLWCNDEWDALQTLLASAAYLVAKAVDMRWPLRGALAYGNCVLDRNSRTFIGQPIIEAYEAEQSQQWVGAAITRSLLDHPVVSGRLGALEDIIEYSVPVKDGLPALSHALHWCPYSSRARQELETARLTTSNQDAKLYYSNAILYVTKDCGGYHSGAQAL